MLLTYILERVVTNYSTILTSVLDLVITILILSSYPPTFCLISENRGYDNLKSHLNLQESVNCSLLNLLSYPWIEEKVCRGHLCLHGGYYDFTSCTYEKWTLDYSGSVSGEGKRAVIKDRSVWAWDPHTWGLAFRIPLRYGERSDVVFWL